ncbi:MAG: hypothetical protein Q8Q36_03230 [bacterium]|nr:hypothetical protein [bacterium]
MSKNIKLIGNKSNLVKQGRNLKPNSYSLTPARGFILPFAVLLSGILLAIGLAVFNLILKQSILASSGRESQFAFYAADSGAECALFWDAKQGIFPTSSDSALYGGAASCGGVSIMPFDSVVRTGSAATTTFDIDTATHCVIVTVAKFGESTKIESEGFNTCNTADPRRVERAIRIVY